MKIAEKQLGNLKQAVKDKEVRYRSVDQSVVLRPLIVSLNNLDGGTVSIPYTDALIIPPNTGITLGNLVTGTTQVSFETTVLPNRMTDKIMFNAALMLDAGIDQAIGQVTLIYINKNYGYSTIRSDIINITKPRTLSFEIPADTVNQEEPFTSGLRVFTNKRIILRSSWINLET